MREKNFSFQDIFHILPFIILFSLRYKEVFSIQFNFFFFLNFPFSPLGYKVYF